MCVFFVFFGFLEVFFVFWFSRGFFVFFLEVFFGFLEFFWFSRVFWFFEDNQQKAHKKRRTPHNKKHRKQAEKQKKPHPQGPLFGFFSGSPKNLPRFERSCPLTFDGKSSRSDPIVVFWSWFQPCLGWLERQVKETSFFLRGGGCFNVCFFWKENTFVLGGGLQERHAQIFRFWNLCVWRCF